MNEYEKYLEDVLNNAYDEVLPLVKAINKIGFCPCCGGTYYGAICKYCNTVNEDLKKYVQSLENILKHLLSMIENLPVEKIGYNKLFTLLAKLEANELPIIDTLFKKYHYEDVLEQIYLEIKNKGFDLPLNEKEIDVSEVIIYRNLKNKDRHSSDIEYLMSIFVRKLIINSLSDDKELMISYEAFVLLVKEFTETEISLFYNRGKCRIVYELEYHDNDELVFGTAHFNVVNISDYEVKSLYYNGSNSLLETIFHEINHVRQQAVTYKQKAVSEFDLLQIKDRVLGAYLNGYTKENYHQLSYELEAYFCGLRDQRLALINIGISFNKETNALIDNKLREYYQAFLNKKRTLNGQSIDIDKVFEKILLTHPNLLREYPCLKNLYKIENNLVVRKSNDELTKEFLMILEDTTITAEEKEKYKAMYKLYGINSSLDIKL